MTSGPRHETETAGGDSSDWIRAERDQARDRATVAETIAEDLVDQLAEARAEIADLKARLKSGSQRSADDDSFFTESGGVDRTARVADGSDPTVLPLALGGVALVGVMVTFLSILNNGVVSLFTLISFALTAAIAWAAWQTRVVGTVVELSEQGVVTIEGRGASYRFDLRKPETRVTVQGVPGDAYWQVAFVRRNLDSCVVDDTMVDPAEFLAELRRFRPEL